MKISYRKICIYTILNLWFALFVENSPLLWKSIKFIYWLNQTQWYDIYAISIIVDVIIVIIIIIIIINLFIHGKLSEI